MKPKDIDRFLKIINPIYSTILPDCGILLLILIGHQLYTRGWSEGPPMLQGLPLLFSIKHKWENDLSEGLLTLSLKLYKMCMN